MACGTFARWCHSFTVLVPCMLTPMRFRPPSYVLLLLWLLSFHVSAAAAVAGEVEYFPPPDSQGGWRATKDPARARQVAGVEVRRLDQAFEYASRSSQHGGLLVV